MNSSFVDFLKKNRIDEDLEQIEEREFHEMGVVGNEDPNTLTEEEWESTFTNDSELLSEDQEEGEFGKTWGNELIVNLDFGEQSQIGEGKRIKDKGGKNRETVDKEDTETVKFLRGYDNSETIERLKDRIRQYVYSPRKEGDERGGYVFKQRKYNQNGERTVMSPKELQEIANRKNREADPPPKYLFLGDEIKKQFQKTGKIQSINSNYKVGFIKSLNKLMGGDDVLKNINSINNELGYGNVSQVHFRFKRNGADAEGNPILTNVLQVNVTDWKDRSEENLKRFDGAEYRDLDDKTKNIVIKKLNSSAESFEQNKNEKKKDLIGYDEKLGTFTKNGIPMYGNELEKFVNKLNGVPMGDYDAKGKRFWETFKISLKGSKVGEVANFSLPPVATCNKNSPCISDGCYAVKAYGLYPSSRAAMDVNYALLRNGEYSKLETQIGEALSRKFKVRIEKGKVIYPEEEEESDDQTDDMKKLGYIGLFRWNVSGDLFSEKYLDSICNIAERFGKVGFWLYTKQYKLLRDYKRSIPKNLSIIVSCWGKFNPLDIDEKYNYVDPEDKETPRPFAVLQEKYPMAYLDDGKSETQEIIKRLNENKNPKVCPCTDYSEAEAHCINCGICYQLSKLKDNLTFKKH